MSRAENMAEKINDGAKNQIAELLLKSSGLLLFKKAVFSKPVDKACVKCVMTQRRIGNENMLQAETFFRTIRQDRKIFHLMILMP